MTSKTIVALDGIPATVTKPLFSRPELAITVAAVALAAAGAVVAITLATRDHPASLHPQSGKPPVPANVPGPGGAAIRQAFAQWPKGSLDTLQRLGQDYPKSPVVQLYLGIGLFWDGYDREAETALEAAKKYGRDTPWEIAADNVLHPQFFTGYPVFAPVRPNALLSQGARLQAHRVTSIPPSGSTRRRRGSRPATIKHRLRLRSGGSTRTSSPHRSRSSAR